MPWFAKGLVVLGGTLAVLAVGFGASYVGVMLSKRTQEPTVEEAVEEAPAACELFLKARVVPYTIVVTVTPKGECHVHEQPGDVEQRIFPTPR